MKTNIIAAIIVTLTIFSVISANAAWRTTEESDPITDATITTYILPAETGRSKWDNQIGLFIRDNGEKIQVFIHWGEFVTTSSPKVLTRFGKQEAKELDWSISTNHKATFYKGNVKWFIDELVKENKLVARTTPYGGGPSTAIFDAAGIEEIANKIFTK